MNWDECLDLLKEAHEEPVAPAHYAAVRARVMGELARRQQPWWSRGWVWAIAGGLAVLLMTANVDWRPAVEPLPAVALVYPAAPAVEKAANVARAAPRPAPVHQAKEEPLLIRVMTDDPDVVIYWIADKRGDE